MRRAATRDRAIVAMNLCIIAALLFYLHLQWQPARSPFLIRSSEDVIPLTARQLAMAQRDRDEVTTYSVGLRDSPQQLFLMEFIVPRELEKRPKTSIFQDMSFAEGMIWPLPGADGREFLRKLALLHGNRYKDDMTSSPQVPAPFGAIILGKNMVKQIGETEVVASAFDPSTSGPWTATKLVLGEWENEIYFHLNPTNGFAELALKDPAEGEKLTEAFAGLFAVR